MSNKAISVYAKALQRNQEEEQLSPAKATSKVTRETTRTHQPSRDSGRDHPRVNSRESSRARSKDRARGRPREKSRDLPSREEIQEFSFRLRDELKVKVQAEVPHPWQKDLEEIARELDVKKLELYRFIIGEFLGKVKRQRPA